jgi:hypothetical protein
MLLDPAGLENPRDHIRFRDEIAVGMTKVGETTINYVGLNRLRLVEERLEHLQYLRSRPQVSLQRRRELAASPALPTRRKCPKFGVAFARRRAKRTLNRVRDADSGRLLTAAISRAISPRRRSAYLRASASRAEC